MVQRRTVARVFRTARGPRGPRSFERGGGRPGQRRARLRARPRGAAVADRADGHDAPSRGGVRRASAKEESGRAGPPRRDAGGVHVEGMSRTREPRRRSVSRRRGGAPRGRHGGLAGGGHDAAADAAAQVLGRRREKIRVRGTRGPPTLPEDARRVPAGGRRRESSRVRRRRELRVGGSRGFAARGRHGRVRGAPVRSRDYGRRLRLRAAGSEGRPRGRTRRPERRLRVHQRPRRRRGLPVLRGLGQARAHGHRGVQRGRRARDRQRGRRGPRDSRGDAGGFFRRRRGLGRLARHRRGGAGGGGDV
mmetsp:Transcript_910/g.2709  ORF Transcript_910/g.2709 Transcript_910/m.2709 type:complete len:306 (+) Transcript_910:668-1585(+)